MQPNRGRRLCAAGMRLLLVGMGVCGALFVAEAVAKIADVRAQRQFLHTAGRISRTSDIPGVRYELIPGVRAVTPRSRVEIQVNSLGFRGPEVQTPKPEGSMRIAVLGDSIAFGRTYEEVKIFPTRLAALLNLAYPDTPTEVINASLSGRDTWEEAALLEHKVLDLDPDVVVLQICLNDHVRVPPPPKHAAHGMFGEQAWYEYSSLLKILDQRIKGFREHHVAWLQRLHLDFRTPYEVMVDQVIRPDQMIRIEQHWDEWSEALRRIVDRTREHGAEVVFIVFPFDYLLVHGMTESAPPVTMLARELDVPLIDMLDAYAEHPRRMLRDYTHPTPAGHAAAAEALARVISPYVERMALERKAGSTDRDPAFAGSAP